MKKQQLPRQTFVAALPAAAAAADLDALVSRKASEALYEDLRAAQWVRNHERKSYDAAEWAARHERLQAEAKAAKKDRRLWARAKDASAAALEEIPSGLRGAAFAAEEWASRCGLIR